MICSAVNVSLAGRQGLSTGFTDKHIRLYVICDKTLCDM